MLKVKAFSILSIAMNLNLLFLIPKRLVFYISNVLKVQMAYSRTINSTSILFINLYVNCHIEWKIINSEEIRIALSNH
jgi:hypothetical protein